MKELTIDTNDLSWEVAESYPRGAMQKVLDEGSESTPRIILLKLEAGWMMEAHSHIDTELHFVIEGEYQTHNDLFRAGTFRLIPRHTNHGPFSTSNGALLLVVWVKE